MGFGVPGQVHCRICAAAAAVGGGASWLLGPCGRFPDAEAQERLCSLPGVGPKVAACICLFSLDKAGRHPVDTHVWALATEVLRATPGRQDAEQEAARRGAGGVSASALGRRGLGAQHAVCVGPGCCCCWRKPRAGARGLTAVAAARMTLLATKVSLGTGAASAQLVTAEPTAVAAGAVAAGYARVLSRAVIRSKLHTQQQPRRWQQCQAGVRSLV